MSDESTETTTERQPETLSATLQRLTGDGGELEGAKFGAEKDGGKLGLSLAVFPTADVPSQNAIVTPVQLEQSGPSKLAVGQHKRIKTWIGKRSKRGGPKEPQAGTHIEP